MIVLCAHRVDKQTQNEDHTMKETIKMADRSIRVAVNGDFAGPSAFPSHLVCSCNKVLCGLPSLQLVAFLLA